MSQQQEPLQEGDTVEVFGDRRTWLNGLQGRVFDIIGDRIHIYFEGAIAAEKQVVVLRKNVRKVKREL
ncbi:MAG TPA: hypothetical protein VHV10_04935 [Ktedonobacteraceae bacterium]|jgi:hypothetical protein|nr:hypothetical protein [Ktedonobacteraceae bacterium]